jgi:hypothetical protein
MPANYDFKRLIGWFKRAAGTVVAMHTYETEGGGLQYLWDVPTLEVNLANTLTTTRRTDVVKVPLNFSVLAKLHVRIYDAASNQMTWIYCPDLPDTAPADTATAPMGNIGSDTPAVGRQELTVRTSATGTIAARSTLATVDSYFVVTTGFIWARRN